MHPQHFFLSFFCFDYYELVEFQHLLADFFRGFKLVVKSCSKPATFGLCLDFNLVTHHLNIFCLQ